MGKQQEEYQYFHTLIVISPPKSGHAKKLLIVDCFPHYSLHTKLLYCDELSRENLCITRKF